MTTLDDDLDDMIGRLHWTSPNGKFMLHYDLSLHKYMMTSLDIWIQDDTLISNTLMISLIIIFLIQTKMKPCFPKQ